MIALKKNLPPLINQHGKAVAFRRAWLRQALESAAERAGYDEWWLAAELTRTVSFFLEFQYSNSVIEAPQLENVVRSTLRKIGYEEIASHFGSVAAPCFASFLDFLVPEARHPLRAFFQNLGGWIRALRPGATDVIHLKDLQHCTRLLGADGLFPLDADYADHLQTRVIEYARRQVQGLKWRKGVSLVIC